MVGIKEFIKENNIEMVDFKMIDLDGRWRHLTIPASRFQENIFRYGIGFDASNYGYAPIEKSDMIFIPDPTSATIDPFAQAKTLAMIGDVYVIGETNEPFGQYPRNVSRRAIEFMRKSGVADEMIIGPEFEFHIFDKAEYKLMPGDVYYHLESNRASWSHSARQSGDGYMLAADAGYHADIPQDADYDLRSRMSLELEKLDIAVKYHHHEVGGSGQHEIEVELGNMEKMADDTMMIKYVVKNSALRAGKTATFMPKPIRGEAGNGMHVHMLLKKDGEPLFYDKDGYAQLSQIAMYFMGGILSHISSLSAFTNPSTNSYRRLTPGFEAPVVVGFATANRSAIIRVPAYAKTPSVKRFELRNPDATANPYYAYSAILMAGLDGIEKKIDPAAGNWGPFDFNLYSLSEDERGKIDKIPTSLIEAIDALESDHDYLTKSGVFPEELIKVWCERKRREAREISEIPHPAEFIRYYDI